MNYVAAINPIDVYTSMFEELIECMESEQELDHRLIWTPAFGFDYSKSVEMPKGMVTNKTHNALSNLNCIYRLSHLRNNTLQNFEDVKFFKGESFISFIPLEHTAEQFDGQAMIYQAHVYKSTKDVHDYFYITLPKNKDEENLNSI